MGLIRVAQSAVGSTLADQWKDFFTVSKSASLTSLLLPAENLGTNHGSDVDEGKSKNVISNGSKIVVPEGFALITLQDGAITSVVNEPGPYIWNSEDENAQSIFAGDGITAPILRQSWERFKFGGIASSQQKAYFVSSQEVPNNKFGTQSEIYWDDAFLKTQVGAIARGTYSIRICDPILFVKTCVPGTVIQNNQVFDLADSANPLAAQLFSEFVSVLSATFSRLANEGPDEMRMYQIQADSSRFVSALVASLEEAYDWKSRRGLEISQANILSITYDEATKALLSDIQRADSLQGERAVSNLQASLAKGLESAGSSDGAIGIIGMTALASVAGLGQILAPESSANSSALVTKMTEIKKLLDLGLISQEDFDATKKKLLDS